jgi:hypothetical protein
VRSNTRSAVHWPDAKTASTRGQSSVAGAKKWMSRALHGSPRGGSTCWPIPIRPVESPAHRVAGAGNGRGAMTRVLRSHGASRRSSANADGASWQMVGFVVLLWLFLFVRVRFDRQHSLVKFAVLRARPPTASCGRAAAIRFWKDVSLLERRAITMTQAGGVQ